MSEDVSGYLDYMQETVGKEWVDKLLKAVAEAKQALQLGQ